RGGLLVQLGPARSGLVDLNASPLRYQGWGVGAGLGWRAVSDLYRTEVLVSGAGSRLTSSISTDEQNRETTYEAAARASVMRRVHDFERPAVTLFAGAQLSVAGLGRFHSFPHGASETFADFFVLLGPAVQWEHQRRGGTVFSGAVAVPLISAVARTPYYGFKDTPTLEWRGPAALPEVSHTLRMERPLSPRTSMLVEYRAALRRDEEPRPLRHIGHWVSLGLELRRRPH
ncbi:MAG TPA: hypothetical protein VK928_11435, partial [Longimicrobiales bacterium]|nr:hypothetical protein [Longimicrobiales bacterium]